eukprot:CAMPEP_0197387692 /NCGR_PEP_ID=MMETSP1165-20131217/673_1 /TAXON_ID=284809 /ORGANISM="Chrysocystis fragilis, Strain CCMP3189" /LENGTH=138 /DNA_ID=CAMNT_0042913025 /DNA_START=84 /DNA_END=500 /DNA_ORIENTATION=-
MGLAPQNRVETRLGRLRAVSNLDIGTEQLRVGSVHATVDVLRKAIDACDKEFSQAEELAVLKTTLVDHLSFIQKQIDFYDDDTCDVDAYQLSGNNNCSGDSAELRALTKYIDELRALHETVDDQVRLLDERLATAPPS